MHLFCAYYMPGPVLYAVQTHNRVGCGPCSQVLMGETSRERQRRHYSAGTPGMWLAYCFSGVVVFGNWGGWQWINCAGGELVWGQKKGEVSTLHIMSGLSQHYISQSNRSITECGELDPVYYNLLYYGITFRDVGAICSIHDDSEWWFFFFAKRCLSLLETPIALCTVSFLKPETRP